MDDTGLYYYNARYYDATIGRFISADTIVQNPTNPQSLNRYSYVLNNPLKYTDPSGLEVKFENEEYILSLLDPDIIILKDSPLGKMIDKWATARIAWEKLKKEEPKYTQYMEKSDITFKITDIALPSKTISFNIDNMPIISFDEPVQLSFVNGFEMTLIMWGSTEVHFPWCPTGVSLYPDPIYVKTGLVLGSAKAFTNHIAHELYHRWEQSEFASHPEVLGNWYRMYRLEVYRHPLSHDMWPSEIRATNYANTYFPK